MKESWREFRAAWKAASPIKQREILEGLTPEEQAAVNWWLVEFARDKQVLPEEKFFCWLLRSGRGFGKTRVGAETIIEWVREGYTRLALVGQTKGDVRDTMIEVGDSSILRVAPPAWMPIYEPSKRRLYWPQTGAVAMIYSGDEPDQLRGPQHEKAWVDELAKFMYPELTWDNLEFGMRIGDNPQVVVTTTPRPIKIIRDLIADDETVQTVGSSYENEENLAPSYKRRVIKKYENTRLGKQEIHGQILEDVPGALWTRAILESTRVNDFPELFRVGIGVDPHATTGETGIIAAGIGYVGREIHGYILDDKTTGGLPSIWASAVVSAYNSRAADIIVGEINNGGDMIENTIRSVKGGKTVSYKTVRATKGKYTRAEPVAALYEQGRVHHVGYFNELEDQQCSYVPGEESPNNMDAAVWILTELMLDEYSEDDNFEGMGTVENYQSKWK